MKVLLISDPGNLKHVILVYCICIFLGLLYFSFVPDNSNISLPIVEKNWNLLHIPAYALFTIAIYLFLSCNVVINFNINIFSVLCATLMGAFIELMQPMMGRTMSWNDFMMNEMGVVSAIILIYIFSKLKIKLLTK